MMLNLSPSSILKKQTALIEHIVVVLPGETGERFGSWREAVKQ